MTGERIRDKIAASKARGIWMGGNLPLGYDVKDRKLFIVEEEADLVRHMYSRYVQLGSVLPLVRELDALGKRTKRWTSSRGNLRGGYQFSCGAIYHILSNRVYLGDIVHQGKAHKGEHQPIISQKLFDAVAVFKAIARIRVRDTQLRVRLDLAALLGEDEIDDDVLDRARQMDSAAAIDG